MSGNNGHALLEHSLVLVKDSPGTVSVLRTLRKRHGEAAAMDALLLVLIKRCQRKDCAFSYLDAIQEYYSAYPAAIPLLDQALSMFSRDVIRRTLRQN
jgi:hypothetical protein